MVEWNSGYSAATIDMTFCRCTSNRCYRQEFITMNSCCRIYCVRVWPYLRCGSDHLPYMQQRAYCEAEEVRPNVTNNRK